MTHRSCLLQVDRLSIFRQPQQLQHDVLPSLQHKQPIVASKVWNGQKRFNREAGRLEGSVGDVCHLVASDSSLHKAAGLHCPLSCLPAANSSALGPSVDADQRL